MTELLEQPETMHPAAHEAAAAAMALETDPNLQRAVEVGMAIDPEGVLPVVEIVPDPQYKTPRGTYITQRSLIMHGQERVGTCTLVMDKGNKASWFNGIEVDTKGAGFGSAAYKVAAQSAMRNGYDFTTHDWSQTESSKKVWDRLVDRGVAQAIEPFKPDGHGRYVGKYVIPAAGGQL